MNKYINILFVFVTMFRYYYYYFFFLKSTASLQLISHMTCY